MTLVEEVDRRQRVQRESRGSVEFDRTILVAPLVTIHFILAYLVRLQYAQEVSFRIVIAESWVSLPLFYFLLSLPRKYFDSRISQLALTLLGVAVGSYLVYIANEEGYYATMQRAPPLGTLFAWIFMELAWNYELISLSGVALYLWYTGYSL